MKKFYFIFSLLICFALSTEQLWGADVVDQLTASDFAATNTTYTDFSNVGKTSNAQYAGNSGKDSSGNIQMRSKNSNSGIVSTTSGGKVKSVKITVGSGSNTVDVYGSNTAYTAASDLYDTKKQGTKIGSVTATGTVTFSADYEYVGIRSNNGAIYLSGVEITWTTSSGDDPTPTPTLSVSPTTIDFGTVEQGASVDNKTTAVTFANLTGSISYSGLSSPFTASGTISATGDEITIAANTSIVGEYSQTLTVQSSADSKSEEITVTMNVVKPFDGLKLTFDVSSNPGEWPTTNSTTTTNYTYTLNSTDYTFALNNVKCNSGYLMLTTTAKLGLPAISGYKLVKIEASNSGSCSTSTKVKVTSDEAGSSVVTGGTEQTWSTTSSTYTYSLSGTAENTMYYLIVSNKNCQLLELVLYYEEAEAPAVATPTISGETSFVSSTSVTLACETDGASIYYTTDGSTPTSSSTAYSAPFTLSTSATVKAIAIKSGTSSEVATQVFTKVEALTTMDAIFAAATATGNAETDKYITFNNWVVSGAKGNTAYVTDGTKGFIVYYSNHGFTEGDILSGTASFKLKLYNGAAEVTAKNSGSVTITKGGTAALNELDADGITALTGINTGSLIKISGECTSSNSKYYVGGVQLYNTLFGYSAPTAGKNYDCTGVYLYFKSGNNAAVNEILPRSQADIEEVVEEGAPEAPTFSPAAGTYTEVKNVNISCATEGATIYYTTDGTTPTSASTQYTTAISVGETMTIKAIAIKNSLESALATATYTINLPLDESTAKEWNLTAASYDEEPTTDLIQWSGTYVSMKNERNGNSNTAVNNYIPTTQTSTRFYKSNKLTITPSGKKITSILFSATTSGYATVLANSTWTNAVASVSNGIVTVTPTDGEVAISVVMGNTCGFSTVRVNYTAPDLTKPATPTFSVAEGTYAEAQSVEVSCTTQGATIYYTTDGSVPTNASTEYTEAISVGKTMTIKAIAIKDGKSSAVATATYTINLPENEETSKTWDLSTDQTATATTSEMTWTATYVSMSLAKGSSSTNANNAYPGSATPQDHTRIYKDQVLTITPNNKQITKVEIVTTYSTASTLASSTWSNATAQALSSIVTVTPLSGTNAISATITGACRLTSVKVSYTAIDESIPVNPTFSPAAGTYTSAQSVEISTTTEGATIYYTTDGSTPTSESTEYTTALTVGEDMTIKAIAIKDSKSSGVVTAEYTINIPELPEGCDGADDFITATNTSASSYDVERTTTNGWTSVNAALTTISEEACWLTINGKTSAVGVITSPTLNNGISSLKVRYANTFTEANGVSIKVEIKQGETTAKEYTITKENADVTKGTVYTETIENINVAGDFQIVITNLSPSNNSSSNKDRVSIGKLCWTNYSAPADPELIWTDARTGLTEGNYYTICYAKKMTTIRGGLLFSLGGLETNSVYLVQEDAPFEAGRPYILYATADKLEAVVEGDDAPAGSYNGLYGTLSPMSAAALDAAGATYMLYNNSIRAIGTNNSLAAGRAYIILNEIPGGAPSGQAPGRVRRMPMQGNVATDIEANGLIDKPTKVMIDGQLFILRNESMYDMTGRLVK